MTFLRTTSPRLLLTVLIDILHLNCSEFYLLNLNLSLEPPNGNIPGLQLARMLSSSLASVQSLFPSHSWEIETHVGGSVPHRN